MLAYKQLGNYGRLGNQLWELASTIGVAKSIGDEAVFPEAWKYKDIFSVPSQMFKPQHEVDLYPSAVDSPLLDHMHPAARAYMQDINLWSNSVDTIRSYLRPSDAALMTMLTDFAWYYALPRPITAIHVRRGDNVYEGEWKAQYHPVPSMDYYQRAVDHVNENWTTVGSQVVFSDDLEWCQQAFPNAHIFTGGVPMPKEHEVAYAAATPSDWLDFFALTAADHIILSNSTFGWWAAWLSRSKDVIYPKNWFGPALNYIDASLMFTNLEWVGM